MIRVLQVVTNMDRGGIETMLMNYYRYMDRDRVQFDFLVHRKQRAAYDDEIEALGGRIFRLKRLIPWQQSYLKELDAFFAKHTEYKIVHIHQDCLSSVILKAAKRNGVPVRIAHSHTSSQNRDLKYPVKLFYMKKIPTYATHLFACGSQAGDWMFGGHPYQTMKNAIDAAQFSYNYVRAEEVREKLKIGKGEYVVGHVGSFGLLKNHAFLIDVFGKLAEKNENARLLLVGDGPRKNEIINKVNALGLADKVIFTGIRSDVADLMQVMDVFVLPSLYEGLPVTMVEAQAAGLPCVISDRVPQECILTKDLVSTVSLSESAETWAEAILEKRAIARTNRFAEIEALGFDVTTEVKKLQEFYLNEYEKQL